MEVAGLFAVVAGVLVVGGAFKVVDPGPTAQMFGSLGLPASRPLSRVSGVAEVALGTAAFLFGGLLLEVLVAVAFLIFAAMTGALIAGGGAASCGCFGRLSSPPTGIHVAVNLGAACLAALAVAVDAPGFVDLRSDLPDLGMTYLLLVGIGTWLGVVALTVLPDTMVATRRGPVPVPPADLRIRSIR